MKTARKIITILLSICITLNMTVPSLAATAGSSQGAIFGFSTEEGEEEPEAAEEKTQTGETESEDAGETQQSIQSENTDGEENTSDADGEKEENAAAGKEDSKGEEQNGESADDAASKKRAAVKKRAVLKAAPRVNIKEGDSKYYGDEWISTLVSGTIEQPAIINDSVIDDVLNQEPRKAGEKNDSKNTADSIWKTAGYDPASNTVRIEMDYFRQLYTSSLDFIFVIDETGTMNKDIDVTIDGTIYRASRAFWAREVALRASKFIFDWNNETTGFDNRTCYVSWGGTKYVKSGFQTSYEDASRWYQENSRIVGGGTNHNRTAAQIKPIIDESKAAGRTPVVIYLSDFGCMMNHFTTASQQLLTDADVYPVMIYANDKKSELRRSKLNEDPSHQKKMTDNDPTTLLPVFGEIITQAISSIDPNTTVTDTFSKQLAAAADSGVTVTTGEEDAAAKNADHQTDAFKAGGQTSYADQTATWTMNNGTDESGQYRRLTTDANSVYTSTISVPMKSDAVVSGSMPTNSRMEVKNAKGEVVNAITDSPVIGKGVQFVLGILDENGSRTSNVINNATFTLSKDGVNLGDYTTKDSGSFTVPYGENTAFLPGEVYTLTQKTTDTGVALLPEVKTWTLTVNADYTISASYAGDEKYALTAENGSFFVWNQSKATALAPLVPVVVKKVWNGYTATTSDSVSFTVLGNDGKNGIELPAYNMIDRTAEGFAEVTELKASDTFKGEKWAKQVYVPAYSGTGSAKNVFYDVSTNSYHNATAKGYTIKEGDLTLTTNAGSGSWETEASQNGTATQTNNYITYSGKSDWKLENTKSACNYYRLEMYVDKKYEKKITNVDSLTFEFDIVRSDLNHKKVKLVTSFNELDQVPVYGFYFHITNVALPTAWGDLEEVSGVNGGYEKIIPQKVILGSEDGEVVLYDKASGESKLYQQGSYIHFISPYTYHDNSTHRVALEESVYSMPDPIASTKTVSFSFPILQLKNTFTPSHKLTIRSAFTDASINKDENGDKSDHTGNQVKAVSYRIVDRDGNTKIVTLKKTPGTLECTPETVELPAGSYTVQQDSYILADGRRIEAEGNGSFKAYQTNAGSQSVELDADRAVSFTNRRLTHRVTVKTAWEFEEDKEKTTTYTEEGAEKTVKNEDIVIPFTIGSSIFRIHGTNQKTDWSAVYTNIPSYGVDGNPIDCELDFDRMEKESVYRPAQEVLYRFNTEIARDPKDVSGDSDVTFTINIQRNRMPLVIKKIWTDAEGKDASGKNESITFTIKNAKTGETVVPQYEESEALELTADENWQRTFYLPGGTDYTIEETEISGCPVNKQDRYRYYTPSYEYRDRNGDTTKSVWLEAYEDTEAADYDSSYLPEAELTNTLTAEKMKFAEINVHFVYYDGETYQNKDVDWMEKSSLILDEEEDTVSFAEQTEDFANASLEELIADGTVKQTGIYYADRLKDVGEHTLSSLKFQDGAVFVDGGDTTFDGEVWYVYELSKETVLPVKCRGMQISGNPRDLGAGNPKNLTLTGRTDQLVKDQVSPAEINEYSFAGTYAIGSASDYHDVYAISENLRVRNSLEGVEYSVDGKTWTTWEGDDPAIYVIYHMDSTNPTGVRLTWVTVTATPKGEFVDPEMEIPFYYQVAEKEWYGSVKCLDSDTSYQFTGSTITSSGGKPESEWNSERLKPNQSFELALKLQDSEEVPVQYNASKAELLHAKSRVLYVKHDVPEYFTFTSVTDDNASYGEYDVKTGIYTLDTVKKPAYTKYASDRTANRYEKRNYKLTFEYEHSENTAVTFTDTRQTAQLHVEKTLHDDELTGLVPSSFSVLAKDSGDYTEIAAPIIDVSDGDTVEADKTITVPAGAELQVREANDQRSYITTAEDSAKLGSYQNFVYTIPAGKLAGGAEDTVSFTNTRAVCKIADGGKDHPFATLQDALNYAKEQMGGRATIQMLVSRELPQEDAVRIENGEQVVLTTAAKKDRTYPSRVKTATLSRGFANGALIENAGDLTIGRLTLDGNNKLYSGQSGSLIHTTDGSDLRIGTGASVKNNDGSDGAILTENATVHLSGSPYIYENTSGEAQKNLVIDSASVIKVDAALESDAKIGVWSSKLYVAGVVFGGYTDGNNQNLDRFYNDRDSSLQGEDGGNGAIIWPKIPAPTGVRGNLWPFVLILAAGAGAFVLVRRRRRV